MNDNGLFNRLHAAALRSLCGNSLTTVGRDGRQRVVMETITADGELAAILREIGGEIPRHSKTCAAVKSAIATCDCSVMETVRAIEPDLRTDCALKRQLSTETDVNEQRT